MPQTLDAILQHAERDGDPELARLCRTSASLIVLAAYAKRLALQDVSRAVRLTAQLRDAASSGDPQTVAHISAARAYALSVANDFSAALEVLAAARAVLEPANDSLALAQLDLAAVQPLARLGRFDGAEQAGLAARDAFAARGYALEAAMADVNLGVVVRMAEHPARALTYFERARPVLAADPVRRAMIDSNRAEAFLDLDDFTRAAAAFEAARDGFLESNDGHAAAVVESNLAHLYTRQGRVDQALERFERARRAFEQGPLRGDLAGLCAEEAEALALAGAFIESRRAFQRAVTILDEVGLSREAARARLGEAVACLRLNQIHQAQELLADAEARFQALDALHGVTEVRLVAAELAGRTGAWDRVPALLEPVVSDLAGRPVGLIRARLLRARAYLRCRALHAARVEIDAVASDPRLAELPALRPQTLHLRGLLHQATVRLEDAHESFLAALDALDETRSSLRFEALRSSFVSAHFDLFHDTWTNALDIGGSRAAARAFDALERMRARTLLDVLHAAPLDVSGAAEAEHALAIEYRSALTRLERAYDHVSGVESVDGACRLPPSAADAQVGELERRLRATQRFGRVLGRAFDLAEAQRRLHPDQAVIKFFVDRNEFSAMVVRTAGTHVVRGLADRSSVGELIEHLRFAVESILARGAGARISPRLLARCDTLRGELHRLLLAPLVEPLDGAARLGIVPAAELHGVSLHALGDEFLPAAYLPSATIGLRLADSAAHPPECAHGLAVGVTDAGAPQMEAEAVAVANHSRAAELLTGAAATRAAFIAAARHAAWIHLAVHGVFSAAHPLAARLRFADGWLSAREIAGLRLQAGTVVLASCDTGQAVGDAGEERVGLIRAFLVAGARRVIASLWPLHDATARLIFEHYYGRGRETGGDSGNSAARLTSAVAHCAADGAPWAYWAGLIQMGAMQ